MKYVKKYSGRLWIIYIIILISLLQGCSKNDDNVPDNQVFQNLFDGFDPVYNYSSEETEMLGHASCIAADGFTTWYSYSGVSDSLGSEAIKSNSMFRIASATKMFTSVMILQLWERGLIDLDTPFNNYLDLDTEEYPKIDKFRNATVRHLLSHRSGLCNISSTTFFDDYFYTDAITQDIRMKYLFTDCDPEFTPGTLYSYRNSNFNVLGLIIEKVTGKSYQEVLEDEICTPLNMSNTFLLDFGITGDDNNVVHGYTMGFDGTDYHGSQAWAAGGILSTVHDLYLFMHALVNGDLFQDYSTFELMSTPVDGGHYGLGLFINQTPKGILYGHSGAIFGYNTRLEYSLDVQAIIISSMNFYGYDFMVTNWYDEYCYPVIDEINKARGK